jgi:hypothetical protein
MARIVVSLRNPERYLSVSALAPIANPMAVPSGGMRLRAISVRIGPCDAATIPAR